MRRQRFLWVVALVTVTASACGGGSASPGVCAGAAVVAHEANDYAFSSTLTFPPITVAPNKELTFDWSGVTADLIGHPVDPVKDIMMVNVLMWNLTLEDLQTKVNADSLAQRDLTVVPATYSPTSGETSAKLLQFTLAGNPLTPDQILPYFDPTMYDPADHTYTVMAASGTVLGQGTRMIQSFRVDPASTNTTVTTTSNSTKLDFTANLHSLQPTNIPAGQKAITLDWSQMTTNALGNDFTPLSITDALVAHFTQTPTQLEGPNFLNLDLIATQMYRLSIPSGSVVDFSMLKDASGNSFNGITSDGTWIVALQCGGCRNPAPWYLSVLKPCGG